LVSTPRLRRSRSGSPLSGIGLPALYNPTPKQIAELADADLCLRVGVPFEAAWMRCIQAANSDMPVLDLRDDLPLRVQEHQEYPEGGHHPAGGDAGVDVGVDVGG